MTPAGLKAFTASESAKWTNAIKSGGIKLN